MKQRFEQYSFNLSDKTSKHSVNILLINFTTMKERIKVISKQADVV